MLGKLAVRNTKYTAGRRCLCFGDSSGICFQSVCVTGYCETAGNSKVIFISVSVGPIGFLAVYFLAIYVLVLLNLLRRIRKMTVHDFLYFEKQNEKKMFGSSRKRNILFGVSVLIGVGALFLWHSRCSFEKFGEQSTTTWLMVSIILLILSIYGISATCADMLLSVLLKSKK